MKYQCWLLQYGVAIVLALVLSTMLGSLTLFRQVSLGDTQLTASRLVQFLGSGSALLMLWLLGQRMMQELPAAGRSSAITRVMATPGMMLIAALLGYRVFLIIGEPLLGTTGRAIYDWLFVSGIVGAALWVVMAWLTKAAPLMESWEGLEEEGKPVETRKTA
jgi:hypothetical protein